MRSQSTDLDVFDQIFRQHHLKDVALAAPRTSRYVVDAGANVGYSTMLLASLWQDRSIVVALEPDEGNMEVGCGGGRGTKRGQTGGGAQGL